MRFIQRFGRVLMVLLIVVFALGMQHLWAQDCDGNGISDPIQIAASPELDCNANGILDLCETGGYVSPPVEQDICELAQWMCPGAIYTGSTIGSTNPGYTAGECPGYLGLLDVWYLYVPDSDGSAHITVEALGPTGSDIHVCVYDACPNNGGACTVCTSAYKRITEIGPVAFLSFDALAGNEYYVQVGSLAGKVGNFTIEMVGPNCVTSPDCDGDFVPDECEEATSCGPGVLCYDDGDGAADVILNEPNPASFLVKFSVPEAFGGPRKVTRVTWYAGSGTIESAKVVVRGDLAGGFGTSQACIVEDATAVVPNTFDQVDVSQNPHQFVVHGGDIFYAGVYGGKISIGADTSVTTERMTAINTTTDHWGYGCAFAPIPVPTPTAGPGSKIPCWDGRNYKLDASGTSSPGEMITIGPLGSPSCHYNHRWWSETITIHTSGSDKAWTHWVHNYCQVICRQDFQLRAQDWLIRVTLSGMCSPELISGCTDDGALICDTFQTFTPTATTTFAPTFTPTITPTMTEAPTPGPAGYALYFDGGDYVYLGTDTRLNPQGQYTIEAWVKPATTEAAGAVFTRFNYTSHSYSLGLGPWEVGGPDQDTYSFRCGSPPVGVAALDAPEINVWTHLAGVNDSGTVRLYRNGIFQGELSGTVNDQFDVATLIGADYTWGSLWHHWQGWIDEVRFWSTARSSDDINHWMNYSLEGPPPPGLIGYWNFDESEGQVAHDLGLNGLHGTLGASLDPGDDDPTWVASDAPILAGRPALTSQDCDGNGVSDPIQISASPELDCNGNGILDVCETGGYVSPPVEQDICELAQWICPGDKYFGTTIGANNEGSISGSCGNADFAPDVWYAYRPGSDGRIAILLCDSYYDTVVAVYDGCPSQGGMQLICDDDSCMHRWPEAGRSLIESFMVQGGREYYIRVAGSGTASGNFHIQILGPPCLDTDKNDNAVPDGCEPPVSCGPDVLCYDDGDGIADTLVTASNPASFLVKFSVPDTFTGVKQVAKITWYPGPYPIENPKAVVRGDLSGGFGTTQNCIVENIGAVIPGRLNEVNLRHNPKEFLVGPGDDFYAGVYGSRISIGADTAVTTVADLRTASRWRRGGGFPCTAVYPPSPTVGSGLTIPLWDQRNFQLSTLGTHTPVDAVYVTRTGPPVCGYDTDVYSHFTVIHTYGSGYITTITQTFYCDAFCSQQFQIKGRDWLIRAALAGTLSPELSPGCYDRTFPVGTPTQTPSITPTFTTTPTLTPMPQYSNPVAVVELNSDGSDFRPYLTQDLREIFFVSERTGNRDIWSATRESVEAPWNPPFPVTELNSTDLDDSPVVSVDGLEMFLSSHRGLQPTNNWNRVFRSTRPDRHSPWSAPVTVPELNPSPYQDYFSVPSHLSADGLRIYSNRRFGADYDVYVSSRMSVGAPFSGPTPIPGDVNTTSSEGGATLSGDEMTMIFGRVTDRWNLFMAGRSTPGGPFQVARELTELNDPVCGTLLGFVSQGLTWVWFSSDRPGCPGPHDIYVASMVLETPTPTPQPGGAYLLVR